MIKNFLSAAAVAAALATTLCAGGSAQAAVLTFDDPGVIDIDASTGQAQYSEAGFRLTGLATSFLPLDLRLVGGFDPTPFSLSLADGGTFSLRSFELDFFDLGFGDASSELTITGLLDGSVVASRSVNLGGPGALLFGDDWARLGEVSFSGTAGFALDNLNASAVSAPGTLLLSGVALLALAMRRRVI